MNNTKTYNNMKPAAESEECKSYSHNGYISIILGYTTERVRFSGLTFNEPPLIDPALHDRRLCEQGHREYIRPAVTKETLTALSNGFCCTHVLVREISPGIRSRQLIAKTEGN